MRRLDDFARKQLSVGSWALVKALTFKLVNLEFLELLSDSVPVCTPTTSAWMHLRMERARTEKTCSVVEMQGCCICPGTFFFSVLLNIISYLDLKADKWVKYCKDKACCSCNQKSHFVWTLTSSLMVSSSFKSLPFHQTAFSFILGVMFTMLLVFNSWSWSMAWKKCNHSTFSICFLGSGGR